MISVVERDREKQVMLDICGQTPFGCKIMAIAQAYGFDKRFSMFWIDGRQEAAYCLVDETMIVTGTVIDKKEALSFIQFSGAREVTGDMRNLEMLGLTPDESGEILKKQNPAGGHPEKAAEEAPIREIYALLEETGLVKETEDEDDAFEAFYLDLSHRLRHGVAEVVTQWKEDTLAGCAVLSAVTEAAAILSAVAVREPFRGQGVGTQLVRQAEALLPDKMVYIYKDRDKNDAFYQKLGYVRADTWAKKYIVRPV